MRHLLLIAISLCLASVCHANIAGVPGLEITLQQVPFDGALNTDVQISWCGSGTIDGTLIPPASSLLEFINFGEMFEDAIAGTGSNTGSAFSLTTPLTLMGVATVQSGTQVPFTSSYSTLRLDDESDVDNTTSDDLDLLGIGFVDSAGDSLPVIVGGTYSASGSSLVEGLSFSNLVQGSYFSNSNGNAATFGGVNLHINAIPEPSAFLFGVLITTAAVCRIRRAKSRAAA